MSRIYTNLVVFAGNLTRDPEIRYKGEGNAVCNLTLACNERYGDRENVVYADVVAWGKSAEFCEHNLHKGMNVQVTGSLRSSEWQTKEGEKRRKLEVVAQKVQANWQEKKTEEKKATPEATPF